MIRGCATSVNQLTTENDWFGVPFNKYGPGLSEACMVMKKSCLDKIFGVDASAGVFMPLLVLMMDVYRS